MACSGFGGKLVTMGGGRESEVRRGEASSGGESKGFSALNAGYGRTGACLGVGAEDRSNESSRALSSACLGDVLCFLVPSPIVSTSGHVSSTEKSKQSNLLGLVCRTTGQCSPVQLNTQDELAGLADALGPVWVLWCVCWPNSTGGETGGAKRRREAFGGAWPRLGEMVNC